MKKTLITFFLLVVIFFLFSFVYLKISANGPEDNFFNTNWRSQIAKNYFARQLLGLNDSGDARHDYSGEGTDEILIEIDSMAGFELKDILLDDFTDKIREITGKPARYIYSERNIPYSNEVSLSDLENEAKKHRVRYRKNSQSALYVLVAGSLAGDSERLGSTLGNDGIILFLGTLSKYVVHYSENNNPEMLRKSAIEVLLHEFGHQLGLGHNGNSKCLMSDKTEFSTNRREEDIVLDFCEAERAELSELGK